MSKNDPAPAAKKPDFGRIEVAGLKERKFPANLAGEYRVHLTRHAADKMQAHAATTSEVELCGVLVGEVCKDDSGPYVDISDIIEGKAANNYGSQVTFTHETWAHIHSVMDKQHPGLRIVGWYHTHPGFGVFLSGMDSFIQENFFNEPYHVAIVLETKQDQMGCFAWKEGKSVPLRRLWIGEEETPLKAGEAEPFDAEAPAAREPETRSAPAPVAGGWWGGVNVVIGVAFGCIFGYLAGRYMAAADMQHMTQEAVLSEVYSVLEYAARSAAAGKDFEDVQATLAKAAVLLKDKKEKEAGEALQDAEKKVALFKDTYTTDRNRFQSDMTELASRRRSLAQSIQEVRQEVRANETLLKQFLVTASLAQLDAIFVQARTDDPAKLSPEARERVRQCLQSALNLAPELKPQIKQRWPLVFDYFYPEPKPSTESGTTSENKTPAKVEKPGPDVPAGKTSLDGQSARTHYGRHPNHERRTERPQD